MTDAVELANVTRKLGGSAVVTSVNFRLAAGRLLMLRGANGSGKTTLLRLIAGRLRPTAGTAKVFGYDTVKQPDEVRKRVGMLTVLGGNYPILTATENLRLAADLGVAGPVSEARLQEILQSVGLGETGSKLTRTFSSGMKKRLGLARLILLDPDLWLLDEPHAALDTAGKNLIDELTREAQARGRTIIMASHEDDRDTLQPDATVEMVHGKLTLVAQS